MTDTQSSEREEREAFEKWRRQFIGGEVPTEWLIWQAARSRQQSQDAVDAARYRAMRANGVVLARAADYGWLYREKLDFAIDAAREGDKL